MSNSEYHPQHRTHIIVGAVIITIGLFMLMNNLGFIPYWIYDFFFRWQFIPITLGLLSLITNRSKVPGLVLIMVGVFFLAPDYFREFRNYFIPAAVILVGLAIMLKRNRTGWNYNETTDEHVNDMDYIDIVSIFSGGERQVTSKNFKGGKITSIFGGSEISFLNSDLAPQDVIIETTAIFGGMVLIIPPHWEAVVDVDHVFGGFADKRYFPPNHQFDSTKRIIIKGTVIFGGGEIKSHK